MRESERATHTRETEKDTERDTETERQRDGETDTHIQ